ncbi:MAG: glycosyltransferase family A protein [Pedobacter sp.]|nr:glycosyltransferase family A protein [Pedobacter sp.]MDQ8052897.1 glycosyltransferase family A protein [Pedobacter sp.]
MNNKVSVIIPTYKRPTTLKRAIDSALHQSYTNLEVIVVDDNSDGDVFREETEKLMSQYGQNERVVYLKHQKNQNGAAARNTGILHSSADFIAFLDDDDYFLPTKVEQQISKLTVLGPDWGGASCYHIRRYKKYIYKAITINRKDNGNYLAEFLSEQVSMPSSTLLVRRSVFDRVGLFDTQFYRHQDLEFLVRFFRDFKMTFVEDFQLVMQVEGFRNFPSADRALVVKNMFVDKFSADINALSGDRYKMVVHRMWLPVVGAFFKESRFKTSIAMYRVKVLPYSASVVKDVLFLLYYYLVGAVPHFKVLFAKVKNLLFYGKLNKKLKNDLNFLNAQV